MALRRSVRLARTVALVGALIGVPGAARADARDDSRAARPAAPGILVAFAPNVPAADRAVARAEAGTRAMATLGAAEFQLVAPRQGQTVAGAARALRADPAVRAAEPDGLSFTTAVPNDPAFGQLWGLRNVGLGIGGSPGLAGADIGAVAAWDRSIGTPSTIVADLDTGYRFEHPDLADAAWRNPGEIPGNGIDDDQNGYDDDIRGWDFVGDSAPSGGGILASGPSGTLAAPPEDNDPTDLANGHGVHTAGTIGARGNNGIGIVGVAPGVRVMPVRICGDNGACPFSAQVAGINYAGRNGARVANMSLGGSEASAIVLDALARNPQTLFVVAAGNGSADNDASPVYPCNFDPSTRADVMPGAVDNVVCVAATTQEDALADFSDWGARSVDLGAPGTQILSTFVTTERSREDFEGDGFAAWDAGGFVRSAAAPQTSFGITNDTATQAPGVARIATSPAVTVPAGADSCRASYRRTLAGTGDTFTYRAVVDGVEQPPVAGTNPKPGTYSLFVPLAAGSPHTVSIRFSYERGSASAATNGIWIDDVVLACTVAPGQESAQTSFLMLSGTSMATPHVSGAAALLASVAPAATPSTIKRALLASAAPIAALSGKSVSGGRLDLARALELIAAPERPTPPPAAPPPASVRPPRPAITGLRASPRVFRTGTRRRTASIVPTSTQLRFRSATGGRSTLAIDAIEAGRVIGGRCRPAPRSGGPYRSCRRFVRVGAVAGTVRLGYNSIRFRGRVDGRRLAPGRYRITLVVRDRSGRASAPRTVTVTVVPG